MSSGEQLFNDGAAYERLMGRWSRRVGDVFLDWIEARKGLRWLDVGCGTGAFTEQVIQGCAPAAMVGIDPSAEQLAFAGTRAGLAAAEFRVGDAQDLPFADNSFDIAVMALVIHFVPDPAKAVTELTRVLHRGGQAATYAWDYTAGGSPVAPVPAAMKAIGLESPGPPSPNATSLPALEAFWRTAGFVQNRDPDHRHPGRVRRLRRVLGLDDRAGRTGRDGDRPPAAGHARAPAQRPARANPPYGEWTRRLRGAGERHQRPQTSVTARDASNG
jgi:SAM-dependent methyltransferase